MSMEIRLDDRVALVTGASRGIGRAIALGLAKAGAKVACLARNQDKAAETAAECASLLGADDGACAIACDVGDAASVEAAVKAATAKLGLLHIVVNNAGITKDNILARLSESDWTDVVDVNLGGCYRVTKAASRSLLKARDKGRVINITSVVGLRGNAGQSNYAASKAGIVGFTQSLARELAPRGVTVNAIAPGFIETDMTAALGDEVTGQIAERIGLGRLGKAEDIASVATFLASDLAGYVTGVVVPVDGGLVI